MSSTERPESARWLPADTFRGAVAVVTGGGTGLGLEISRGLSALGATVVIASRSSEHHGAFLAEAAQRGAPAEALVLDVREPDEVERAAAGVVERHGKVDLLVNNAAGNFVCPAERMSARAWRSVLSIVLDGTFYCTRSFGRAMIARKQGVVLNVVATYVYTGMPGVVHSASAKAGVLAMTQSLAAEWARHGIRLNAIAPGPFDTDGAAERLWPEPEIRASMSARIPLGRFADTSDVAAHCLYLLSPAASYVTGECLVVDGGLLLGKGFWEPGQAVRRRKPHPDA